MAITATRAGSTRRRAVTVRGRVSTVRLAATAPTTPTTSTASERAGQGGGEGAAERGRLQLRRRADRDDGEHRHRRADRGADEDGRERGHAEEAGQPRRADAAQDAQPQVAPAFARHQDPGRREQRAGRREPGQADGRHGPAHHLGQPIGVARHGGQTGGVGLELLQLPDSHGGVVAVGRGEAVELPGQVLGLVAGEPVRVRPQLPASVPLLEGDPAERLGRDERERQWRVTEVVRPEEGPQPTPVRRLRPHRDLRVGADDRQLHGGRRRLVGQWAVVHVEHDRCRHREVQAVADLHPADRQVPVGHQDLTRPGRDDARAQVGLLAVAVGEHDAALRPVRSGQVVQVGLGGLGDDGRSGGVGDRAGGGVQDGGGPGRRGGRGACRRRPGSRRRAGSAPPATPRTTRTAGHRPRTRRGWRPRPPPRPVHRCSPVPPPSASATRRAGSGRRRAAHRSATPVARTAASAAMAAGRTSRRRRAIGTTRPGAGWPGPPSPGASWSVRKWKAIASPGCTSNDRIRCSDRSASRSGTSS